jgi:hypothetical protein
MLRIRLRLVAALFAGLTTIAVLSALPANADVIQTQDQIQANNSNQVQACNTGSLALACSQNQNKVQANGGQQTQACTLPFFPFFEQCAQTQTSFEGNTSGQFQSESGAFLFVSQDQFNAQFNDKSQFQTCTAQFLDICDQDQSQLQTTFKFQDQVSQ